MIMSTGGKQHIYTSAYAVCTYKAEGWPLLDVSESLFAFNMVQEHAQMCYFSMTRVTLSTRARAAIV